MNWKKTVSAILACALMTAGSFGCLAAFAEEDFEAYEEEHRAEERVDSFETPEAPAEEVYQELGDDGDDAPAYDEVEAIERVEEDFGEDDPIQEIPVEYPDELMPGEADPDEIAPVQDEDVPVPEITEEPLEPLEPLEEGRVAISMSGASEKSVMPGQRVSFGFRVDNAVFVSYRIVGPDGETVQAGDLPTDARDVSFTPALPGRYTLVVIAEGFDGETVSADASMSAEAVGELSVSVRADSECCLGGESTAFTVEVPENVELAECRITAYQNSNAFYQSSILEKKITVTPPAVRKVTDVTLVVSVTDILGRTAEASATIPCAVNERESRAEWEATMRGVTLTGVWPMDLIAIAKTQVGYRESSVNFGEKHGGGISGYTRYGDWAGMRYDEWCAMFCSFCLHYAGIPESSFPWASNCQRWIEKLRKLDLYASGATYVPQLGDLAFFEWENDNDSDHVGIIARLDTDKNGYVQGFTTIEGNSTGGAVTFEKYYSVTDSRVVGYGLVNAAYEKIAGLDEKPVDSETDVEALKQDVQEADPETENPETTEDQESQETQEPVEETFEEAFPEEDGEAEIGESKPEATRKRTERKEDAEAEEDEVFPGVSYEPEEEADFAEVSDDPDDGSDEAIEEEVLIEAEAEIITEDIYLDDSDSFYEESDSPTDEATGDRTAARRSAPVDVSTSLDGMTVTARADADAALPEGVTLEVTELKPGRDDFDVYVDALRGELSAGEDLGNARMLEVSFYDDEGNPVTPQGAVELTVVYDGKLNASKALRPCVATLGGASGIRLNADVKLTRSQDSSSYTFCQDDFDGVICTYVAGKLKYRTDAVEAEDNGASARVSYSPEAKVPSGAALSLREILPGTEEYDACLARVGGTAESATTRFFETGLELNGMVIEPQDAVKVTLACPQAGVPVKVTRIQDGAAYDTKVDRQNGGAVSFVADGLGIFAVSYSE